MDEFYKKLFALFDEGDQKKTEEFLLEQIYAYNDARVMIPMNELGSFYRGLGRYEEAEEYYEKALNIVNLFGMVGTVQHQAVLINQATLYRLVGDYDASVEQFREVIALADKESYNYVSALNNLAITFISKNEPAKAAELLAEAMEWHVAHKSAAHEIGVTGVNLASVFIRAGEYTRAQEALDKAFEAFDSQDWVDEHYAAALAAQAALCTERGDIEGAKANYRRAMELTEKFFGHNPEYEKAKKSLEALEESEKNE